MQAVFPGRPQPSLQAVDSVFWEGTRFLVYISGNSLIILNGPSDLFQTAVHGDDDELRAVAVDHASGKIATCTNATLFVYQPIGKEFGALRWILEDRINPSSGDTSLSSLSWGLPDEILVSGSHLTLFQTNGQLEEQWSKRLASPVKFSAFSHDASLVATTGWYDKLVKIWRRMYIGGGDEQFDSAYLAHPAPVTSLRWRGRHEKGQHWDAVLYTVCADNFLRVWSSSDPHCLHILHLWTALDLVQSIQPRTPLSPSPFKKRWAVVLDSWDFEEVVESRKDIVKLDREIHALEHLQEIASRRPEVVVVFDEQGNMSTWGLENIGYRAPHEKDVFNFAHAEGLFVNLPDQDSSRIDYACPLVFPYKGALILAIHLFDGRLEWMSSPPDQLFDPSAQSRQFKLESSLTGHGHPVDRVFSSKDGSTLVSCSFEEDAIVWKKGPGGQFARHIVLSLPSNTRRAELMHDGRLLTTLDEENVNVWNVQDDPASKTCSMKHNIEDIGGSSLMILDRESEVPRVVIASTEHDALDLLCFSLVDDSLSPPKLLKDSERERHRSACNSTIGAENLHAQRDPVCCNDQSIVTIDCRGLMRSFHLPLSDSERQGDILKADCTLQTAVRGLSAIAISPSSKVAVLDSQRTFLSIWDLVLGLMEMERHFPEHEPIKETVFSSRDSECAALALLSGHRVYMYLQTKYNDLQSKDAWELVQTIDMTETTSILISDCAWLDNYDLGLAAGNQLFVFKGITDDAEKNDRSSASEDSKPIVEVAAAHSKALAAFHPGFLQQSLLSGQYDASLRLLSALYNNTKFWSEGEPFDTLLDLVLNQELELAVEVSEMSDTTLPSLSDKLAVVDLPYISSEEQIILQDRVEVIATLVAQRHAVDVSGMRYLIQLYTNKSCSWRDILWAYLSNSQDILVDMTTRQFRDRVQWKDARASGLFLWLNDTDAVRTHFETVARNEYTKKEERDPVDCSLYYLALQKKPILQGLWRLATWNREQKATMKFLANDFTIPRWKTAALKNAYALLGRQRPEYAASFFLLAGNLKDAVNVLANQLNDIQLALAVARVYEGDDGAVFRELLETRVLPQAVRDNNPWQAVWALLVLRRDHEAIHALTTPLHKLLNSTETPSTAALHWTRADPSIAHLYKHLVDRATAPLLGANMRYDVPTVQQEHALLMRCVRIFMRMGCDAHALDLVKSWRFQHKATRSSVPTQRPSLANGVTSLLPSEHGIVDGEPDSKPLDAFNSSTAQHVDNSVGSDANADADTHTKPPATNGNITVPSVTSVSSPTSAPAPAVQTQGRKIVTEEPSASSILDNFDF